MQDESLREENAKLKEENKQMLDMIEQLEKKNFEITIEMTATNDVLKKEIARLQQQEKTSDSESEVEMLKQMVEKMKEEKKIESLGKSDRFTLEKKLQKATKELEGVEKEVVQIKPVLDAVEAQGNKERRTLGRRDEAKVEQLKKEEDKLRKTYLELLEKQRSLRRKKTMYKNGIQRWLDYEKEQREKKQQKEEEENASDSLPSENKKWKFGESRIAAPIKRD